MSKVKIIKHHFSSGVYAKHMVIPDEFEVVTHKHNYDHLSILASGCAIVEVDGESQTYYAPAVIEIKAGKDHKISTVNGEAVWFCIHATDCTDEAKVDDVLIERTN